MTYGVDMGYGENAEKIAMEWFHSSLDGSIEPETNNLIGKGTPQEDEGSDPYNSVAQKNDNVPPVQTATMNTPVVHPTANSNETNNDLSSQALVHKRRNNGSDLNGVSNQDLMLLMKVMMVQHQQQRDKEVRRREEEPKAAERCHEQFTEMMMIMMAPNLKKKNKSLFDNSYKEN